MWSAKQLAKDIGGALVGLVLLGAMALIGAGWLTFAVYSALEIGQGPPIAALLTGILAIAPLAAFGVWTWARGRPQADETELPSQATLLALAPRLANTVESLARSRPLEAVIVCVLIGFVAARRPGHVWDLLMGLAGAMPNESPQEKPGD